MRNFFCISQNFCSQIGHETWIRPGNSAYHSQAAVLPLCVRRSGPVCDVVCEKGRERVRERNLKSVV